MVAIQDFFSKGQFDPAPPTKNVKILCRFLNAPSETWLRHAFQQFLNPIHQQFTVNFKSKKHQLFSNLRTTKYFNFFDENAGRFQILLTFGNSRRLISDSLSTQILPQKPLKSVVVPRRKFGSARRRLKFPDSTSTPGDLWNELYSFQLPCSSHFSRAGVVLTQKHGRRHGTDRRTWYNEGFDWNF